MQIPTEPIGSIPRPRALIDAIAEIGDGTAPALEPLYAEATRRTILGFEAKQAVISPSASLAGERDRIAALKLMREHLKPHQRVFVGVVAPIDPRIETAEEVRDRVLEAAQYIPVKQLGTTDDCGFAPFCDDTSTSRETAFARIRARVAGTALATKALEGARVGR